MYFILSTFVHCVCVLKLFIQFIVWHVVCASLCLMCESFTRKKLSLYYMPCHVVEAFMIFSTLIGLANQRHQLK